MAGYTNEAGMGYVNRITMTAVTGYLAYDQEEYLDLDGSGFNFLLLDFLPRDATALPDRLRLARVGSLPGILSASSSNA